MSIQAEVKEAKERIEAVINDEIQKLEQSTGMEASTIYADRDFDTKQFELNLNLKLPK